MMRAYHVIFSLVFMLAGFSCSNYQLGRAGTPVAESIWIDPVEFKIPLSDVAIPFNRELREALIRDTAYKLARSRKDAALILKTIVVERDKSTLARRSSDTGLSDVLGVELFVAYELLNDEQSVLRRGEIQVEGQLFRDEGFNESSRQRTPALLSELAKEILQAALVSW